MIKKLKKNDMTISVRYRVKSLRGIIFRKWANIVLKRENNIISLIKKKNYLALL
jgi:hypothetical protein